MLTEALMEVEKTQAVCASGYVLTTNELPGAQGSHSDRELKSIFFLTHDLNNNLNAIMLQLKLLRQRLAGVSGLGDELCMLDHAQHSILHTTEGMQRLRTHARLRGEGHALNLRAVSLLELANLVAQQNSLQARLKTLNLSVDVPADALVESDPDLIVLILQNLVGNSVKYSTRGQVTIRAQQNEEHDRWMLSVSDEGPGIEPHQLKDISNQTHGGASASQQGACRGLGLAIASEAARLLGAELSVSSQVGVGTIFCLQFPDPNPIRRRSSSV